MWKKSGRIGSKCRIMAVNWAVRAQFGTADWREFAHRFCGAAAAFAKAMRFCKPCPSWVKLVEIYAFFATLRRITSRLTGSRLELGLGLGRG